MRAFALSYPQSMLDATPEQRKATCHGCGPGEGPAEWIVPDSLLGCDIKPACNIHDWGYATGKTWADKKTEDKRFLDNMTALVLNQGGWLKKPRLWLAEFYYNRVRYQGGPFYAKGKNL